MDVSRRSLFGIAAAAAIAPHLPPAPIAAAAKTAPPVATASAAQIWSERFFAEYVRESAFRPYIDGVTVLE